MGWVGSTSGAKCLTQRKISIILVDSLYWLKQYHFYKHVNQQYKLLSNLSYQDFLGPMIRSTLKPFLSSLSSSNCVC